MARLPFELVEDILCRLPVKPLKRFRAVAKQWRSLIDGDSFVKSNLKRSSETFSRRHLIVSNDTGLFYQLDFDNDDDDKVVCNVVKLLVSSVVSISNSCNGWFVISGENLVMWNPFTRETRNLPRIVDSPVPSGCYLKIACGITWDPRNDDYKVVRILEHRNMVIDTVTASWAHIYGLKSNSWRQTGNFTYPVDNCQTDVNGAFHVLTFYSGKMDPYKINAFSVESESHYEVDLPPLGDIWESGAVIMYVHKLGGCLALNYTNDTEIEIWVMKHYGVMSSWKKILSVTMQLQMLELEDDTMKPLVYSSDGNKVLVCFGSRALFWQDVRNQTVVSVLDLPSKINYVEACVESLVSFRCEPPRIRVNDQDKENDKKIRKKRDESSPMGFKLAL